MHFHRRPLIRAVVNTDNGDFDVRWLILGLHRQEEVLLVCWGPGGKEGQDGLTYLRIIRPIRLISDLSSGGASGLGRPLYVGSKASQPRKTRLPCSSTMAVDWASVNSASQLMPLCSRPSSRRPGILSLSVTRYRLASSRVVGPPVAIVRSKPSYADRSQCSTPALCWEAKPAPPSVDVSRCPWKQADWASEATVRCEMLEPPRTRSSEVVQSDESQCL